MRDDRAKFYCRLLQASVLLARRFFLLVCVTLEPARRANGRSPLVP